MGQLKEHPPVKLIIGITTGPEIRMSEIRNLLEAKYGPVETESEAFAFSKFTSYYSREMGEDLVKQFFVFGRLIRPESLADIKNETNLLENRYLSEGRRRVNLDPGYISEAKLVLATTKNYTHRIYLRDGIFGDVHLCFTQNDFQPQPWTYPDYQQPWLIAFFKSVRNNYLKQIVKNPG